MKKTNLIGSAVLSLALCGLALTPARAQAAFSLGVGYSAPAAVYVTPAPVYTAPVATGGHYENRVSRVLVSPERHERRWVSPGYWQDVCVPARYEERGTQVWVPDTVVYSAPYAAPYYAPYYGGYYGGYARPSFGIGFGFSSGYGGWHRH